MHSAKSLKQEFKTIAAAKQHFNLKARGWQALADKLNQQGEQETLIAQLQAEIAQLKEENAALKQSAPAGSIGFWLLNENFDRSQFGDFGVPEMAFRSAEGARAFHRKLAKRFTGTAEQMANMDRLLDQILSFVEIDEALTV